MYRKEQVIAIIPARGGSKRLPGKNIMSLNGKPLIAWTIEAAKASQYIDRIVVSTDNSEIVEISKQYGAEAPFIRPEDLATDTSSTFEVILHCINFHEDKDLNYQYVILLQPTSPLRTTDDINKAFEMLSDKTKAVVSVCETEHSPLWSNTLPNDLSMKDFIQRDTKNIRSQDLPKYYRLNGAIYISEINYFKTNNGFIGDDTKASIMPQIRSVDIDNKTDSILASILISETFD